MVKGAKFLIKGTIREEVGQNYRLAFMKKTLHSKMQNNTSSQTNVNGCTWSSSKNKEQKESFQVFPIFRLCQAREGVIAQLVSECQKLRRQ